MLPLLYIQRIVFTHKRPFNLPLYHTAEKFDLPLYNIAAQLN
jgi:hypothetical protein